jgi:dGTPase
MEWSKLLSDSRLGRSDEQEKKDVRSEYQRDYDRIVYSSAFRRLQDKTQVFPLAESDYVRTRLTHSVEVSCVGRSLQLTYAVLGTYSKYPRRAYIPEFDGSRKVSEKKFGFVQADSELFKVVAENLGLINKQDDAWSRHPLAFLMEAADDICYRIIDLEDGHRVGRVSFKETESLLKQVAFGVEQKGTGGSYALINEDDEKGKIEYLRARAISNLITEAVLSFKQNYETIMSGTFENDLLTQTKYLPQLEEIKMLSRKKVYASPNVLQIEAAGFEVLGGLLEKVVPALVGNYKNKTSAEKKILQLIPPQFTKGQSRYGQLLGATDFVSGMTDSYAVTLYRRLRGIELPRG